MSRLRRLSAEQAEKILKRYGFELVSQKGSHRKWRNLERKFQVIVPFHKGKDLPTGTLRNIMTSADIPEKEWKSDQIKVQLAPLIFNDQTFVGNVFDGFALLQFAFGPFIGFVGTEVGDVGVEPSLVFCIRCIVGMGHKGAGRVLLPQKEFDKAKHLLEKMVGQTLNFFE